MGKMRGDEDMDISKIWQEIVGAIAVITGIWAWLKIQYKKWQPILQPMIESAEADYIKAIADGVITKDERKQIVMNGIKALEANGTIKLNFITRIIVSRIVDKIAQALPDITASKPS